MAKVAYAKENVEKCWCGSCPVQAKSECARELYVSSKASEQLVPPESLPGLYCASGHATCDDLKFVNMCNCPACLVWGENELRGNHYCALGAASQ